MRRLAILLAAVAWSTLAFAQVGQQSPNSIGPTPPTSDNSDRLATTAWVNNLVTAGLPLASGKIWIGSAGNIATAQTPSGDCTFSLSGVITCTQAAGNFQVIGNLSVGGSIIDGNGILATNIVAPATPAAGTTRIYVDSTTKVLTFKNDAGTVGNAVVPSTCGANQFGTSISAGGVFGCTQPTVANIGGFGASVQAALQIAVGSAGAPVLFNGAGGAPTSLSLVNALGLPRGGGGTGTTTGAFVTLKTTAFASSGTYTAATGLLYATLECWGAGGGGGGASNSGATTGFVGGGGGAGSYSRKTLTAASVGASLTVTIGTAGAAGANTGGAGGNGGDSCFTTTSCVSGQQVAGKGGTGGTGATALGATAGGAGGVAGTGDITGTGQPGSTGVGSANTGTTGSFVSGGGSCSIGGGPQAFSGAGAAGVAGTGKCAGGSGGSSFAAGGAQTGGAGAIGFCLATEYVNQ